jgi:hypothetical protein
MMKSSIHDLIIRWKKEGQGQGYGKDYKPWFTAKQVSSRGNTHRPKGIKTGREHLFLSDWEYYYFLLLDWSDEVVEIREQFPLLEITETIEIAKELGVDHPIDPKKNDLKVITTDFRWDRYDGSEYAISFKPFKSITEREIEKMEIERMYWERRHVVWELITEKDIPISYAKNINYVHSTFDLKDYHISQDMVLKAKRLMEPLLLKNQYKLSEITNKVDDRLGLEPGNCLTLARHFIITKQWIINMDQPISPNESLQILRLADIKSWKGEGRRAE